MLSRMPHSCRTLLIALIGLAFAQAALAQPDRSKSGTLIGEEKRVRDEIESADRLADSKKYEEAVRRYRQVLAESGDAFVSLEPTGPSRAIPARWLVHQRIASLPQNARKSYRLAVEDQARKLLEKGLAARDSRFLEQVISEFFCTASGEQALQVLGDMAFERGEFEVAEHYWRMLARFPSQLTAEPPGEQRSFELLYPEAQDGGALAQAKLILALLFRGEKSIAQNELQAFAKLHAESAGHLAGKDGRLAGILQSLLDADVNRATAAPEASSTWSTFAGNDARNSVASGEATPYWPDLPTWRSAIPADPKAKPHRESDPPSGTSPPVRAPAYHPVIAMGCALVADSARVIAYDLMAGKRVAEYDHRQIAGLPESMDMRVPSHTDACHTLTVVGDRLFARFGAQAMKSPDKAGKQSDLESVIVCLSLHREADKSVALNYRWQIRARMLDTDPIDIFEGAPVVRDGRLYAARMRYEGRQMTAAIECYDIDSAIARNEAPLRRWRQEIWTVDVGSEPRYRHELLTLAGPNIVFCTHTGAIVALDAHTGRRAWAYRYQVGPSRLPEGLQPHDLCPCIYANGRILAAPTDSDRILCLDARSGERIWEEEAAHVVQLLGVSHDRLIVTRGGYPRGLRAYATARIVPNRILWTKPDDGDVATYGRGILSDSLIFWPTRHGLRVVRQEDGEMLDAGSSSEPLGNLALSNGFLVAATPTEVWGFVPPRAEIGMRRAEASENPTSAEAHYRFALAEADSGEWDGAISEFKSSEELATDSDWMFGQPLKDLARHRRHELLLILARRSWKNGRFDEARAQWRQASREPFAPADRIRGWLLSRAAGEHSPSEFFDQADLRSLLIRDRTGVVRHADRYLLTLLTADERASLDRWAADFLAPASITKMARFGWSRPVRTNLREAALTAEHAGNIHEAARLYRLVLDGSEDETGRGQAEADRLTARDGLVRIYEKSGYAAAARGLLFTEGDHPANPLGKRNAEPIVQPRSPDIPFPWIRGAGVPLIPFREWPLTPFPNASGEDGHPSNEEGRLFLSGPHRVICRSATGRDVWTRNIPYDASEFASFADSLIVAGPEGISRLQRENGEVVWHYTPSEPQSIFVSLTDSDFRPLEPWVRRHDFHQFQISGARLLFGAGEQRLVALNIETGRLLWRFIAPGAPFRSADDGAGLSKYYLATPERVLVRSTAGEVFGLDAATGRLKYRHSALAEWTGPPIPIDSRRAVYADGPTVHAIELESGNETWSFSPKGLVSTSGSAAQMLQDGSSLLLMIERSYGWEMERLFSSDGKPNIDPIFLGLDPIDLSRSALTLDAYAFHASDRILAVGKNGQHLWEFPVPWDVPWRVEASRSLLICHPDAAIPILERELINRLAFREAAGIPDREGLQRAASLLYHGYLRRSFPVVGIDPRDGKKAHAMDLPACGPRAMLVLGDQPAVVVEGEWITFKPK